MSGTIKKTSHIIVSHGMDGFFCNVFQYMLEVK